MAWWDFCSGRCCNIKNTNTSNFVNVLYKLSSIKRTWPGCPVRPLMISVLLLLWTLAACRGLWRGRYVDFFSVSFRWTLCLFPCLPGTLSHMNNSSLVHWFVSLIFLEGKAEFTRLLWSLRGGTGRRIRKCWVMVKGPTAHLCFFSSLHECVRPVDEGDQDGSLYFLLSRWCFACVFLPCCLSFYSVWGSHKTVKS